LRWIGGGFLGLLGVFAVIAGCVGIVETLRAHEEDGGRARVHSPFLQRPCTTDGDPQCDPQDPAVKFDLRGDDTDEVADQRLYDRARRYGPFTVDVKWRSDSHEVTQVREDGRWRVVAHPADAAIVEALFALGFGLLFLWLGRRVTPI
jgi:hypothetical protein